MLIWCTRNISCHQEIKRWKSFTCIDCLLYVPERPKKKKKKVAEEGQGNSATAKKKKNKDKKEKVRFTQSALVVH